jgi:hypothetical protein
MRWYVNLIADTYHDSETAAPFGVASWDGGFLVLE